MKKRAPTAGARAGAAAGATAAAAATSSVKILPETPFSSMHSYVSELNNSALFAGLVMLIMNVGSRYVQINLSESTEEYLKHILKNEILVFAIAWMGTRNIYYSLIITACFIILADHLTNEQSEYCMLPQHIRDRNKETGEIKKTTEFVSDIEINKAIGVLEKAKRQKEREKNESLLKKHNFFELN